MTIKIGNLRINYQLLGKSGKSLVLVHGWGGNIKSLELLANLSAQKYRCLLIELPGFGQSSCPDSNWGVKEYAELVSRVIHKLGFKQVNYFGHSFGGSLGIFLSNHEPQLINQLVLCNTSFKRENKTNKHASYLQFLPFGFKRLLYRIFFPQSDTMKFPRLEANFRIIIQQDLTYLLQHIKQKTLILWGQKDQDTSIILAKLLHQKIKNSELKIFPGIGHGLPLKQPELVYQALVNFLS